MRLFGGLRLRDTQTGLRGIPRQFFPNLLRLATTGYDFELDMLLQARAAHVSVAEVPIQTVYIDNNKSSHFNPLLDSFKIYLVFLRFNISSLLAVAIDNSVFVLMQLMGWTVLASLAAARLGSGGVNYLLNKRFVFRSDRSHRTAALLYAATVLALGACSYALIGLLQSHLGMNVFAAKILAETALYFASFSVQKEIVFATRSRPGADAGAG
jgi:putative flippase GtrA